MAYIKGFLGFKNLVLCLKACLNNIFLLTFQGQMMSKTLKKPLARPPIVVVVGHVDHGKTSLLDYIRKTNFASKEAGGITQSVGAYEVFHHEKKITFIDTPGHEAFSKMRSRGATVADLAILVVSAEDGVKPQTVEAIKILRGAETPFIVAITKIDKPGANIEKVKNELLANEVLLEGFGGNVSWQPVSSKSGEGINELLDLVLLMGEVAGLTYDPAAMANGFILESRMESARGVIAHIIIKNGTLNQGDEIVTRTASGKLKQLENFLGGQTKSLTPSAPAAVLGFVTIPEVGEEFWAAKSLKDFKVPPVAAAGSVNKTVRAAIDKKKINIILKADTSGALEVLKQIMEPLGNVKEFSVGEITDGDIKLADNTHAVIIGFKVKMAKAAENLAKIYKVKIMSSEIIYELIRDFEIFMKTKGVGEAEGELEVLRVFSVTGNKQVIGGKVKMGALRLNAEIQIARGEEILGAGKITNLQESKKDVRTVPVGRECGLMVESDVKITAGDKIKIYQ